MTFQLIKVPRTSLSECRSGVPDSAAISLTSQSRCSVLSHLALAGASVRNFKTTNPRMTDGTPSTMNIHCQPLKPAMPFICSRTPESGSSDETGDRDGRHEACRNLATPPFRKPEAQIKNNAREEACLGHAQQESQDVERYGAVDQRKRGGDNAPGNHHPGDPAAGSDAMKNQVARNLEQEIADEENAPSQAKHRRGQPQILAHR